MPVLERLWGAETGLPQMGGVTNGGSKGVCPPFLALFRRFSGFSPFSGGLEVHPGNPENGGESPFPADILICLSPPSLKPPFAALKGIPKNCLPKFSAKFG